MKQATSTSLTARRIHDVCLTLFLTALAITVLTGCESPEERASGYVTRAEQLFEEENLVKAELEAKNALQIEPRNPDARFLIARIAESRGDFGEMAANLRAAIESRPDFLAARLKLGTLYALGGALDLADEQLDAAKQLAPEDPDVGILNARLLASRGELEAAAAELQKVLQAKPDSMDAVGLLANVTAASDVDEAVAIVDKAIAEAEDSRVLRMLRIQLLQRGGDDAAVEAGYRELVRDYPEESAYRYQLARFLAGSGKLDEVEEVLRGVVQDYPDDDQPKLALVQFVAGVRGVDEGMQLLQEFVEQNPDAHDLRLLLARQYQAGGDADKAKAEFGIVIERAGNEDASLEAKSGIAALEVAAGNEEEGEKLVEEVLAVDSMNEQALFLRSVLYLSRNELKDAVSDLRSILRNNPDNERAQVLLARAHSTAGDTVLARDAYRRVLEINPANVQATMELTRILVDQKEFDKAEILLREQIATTPEDLNAPRALIAILVTNRRYDDALVEAQRVTELPGQSAVGDFLSGGIYQARDQHEKAVEAFRSALEQAPLTREPLQGLVASLVRLDRGDEAVKYLQDLSAANPDNLYTKTLLGQVLAGSGDTGAAREVFESALSANADWLPAYTALAGLESANSDAQIDIYKRGLEAMPESQELALLLGSAYERTGKYEQAITAYEQVLRSNPEMEVIANNLAALLADHRSDRASFERALELSQGFEDTTNPAFADTLGWVYYRLGEFDKAQPLLELAVGSAGTVPVLRYHLGMNYLAQGKPSLAREQLRLALENPDVDFPGRDEAAARLAEIDGE